MVVEIVVSSVLAALLVVTAARKLSHRGDVVASYERVGVPENRLNALAVVLLAGAAGLIAGSYVRRPNPGYVLREEGQRWHSSALPGTSSMCGPQWRTCFS